MERPRLHFRQAVQGTALNVAMIRNLWRDWYRGMQAERARQYAQQQQQPKR